MIEHYIIAGLVLVILIGIVFLYKAKKDLYEKNSILELLQVQLSEQKGKIVELELLYDSAKDELQTSKLKIKELEVLLEQSIINSKEKLEFLENSKDTLKLEFEKLSNEILEKNRQKIDERTKENIENIIKPFGKEINNFKEQVNKLYFEESKDRNLLKYEINGLKELNLKISQDAIILTNAL